jgi:hypothetical protein
VAQYDASTTDSTSDTAVSCDYYYCFICSNNFRSHPSNSNLTITIGHLLVSGVPAKLTDTKSATGDERSTMKNARRPDDNGKNVPRTTNVGTKQKKEKKEVEDEK